MDLKTARRLRDFLRKNGIKCTVPMGCGDASYVQCQHGTRMRFNSVAEYNAYATEGNRRVQEFMDKHCPLDRRSPIERMVDEACGYKG